MGYLEAAFPSVRVSVLPGCLFGSRRPVFLASFEPSGLGISGSTKRERKNPQCCRRSPLTPGRFDVVGNIHVYFFSFLFLLSMLVCLFLSPSCGVAGFGLRGRGRSGRPVESRSRAEGAREASDKRGGERGGRRGDQDR